MYPPVHQFLKQTNLQEAPLAWLWLDIALSSSGWRSLRVLVTKSAAANLDLMKIFTMQAGPDQNVSKCYMILYDKITWHIFQLVPEYHWRLTMNQWICRQEKVAFHISLSWSFVQRYHGAHIDSQPALNQTNSPAFTKLNNNKLLARNRTYVSFLFAVVKVGELEF
jgi:hypothetical protein